MNYFDWLQNDAPFLLVQSLVHCLWEGMVLLAIASVVAFVIRRRSSQIKYVLWFTTLGLMVAFVPANLFVLSALRPAIASDTTPIRWASSQDAAIVSSRETGIAARPTVMREENSVGVAEPIEGPVLPLMQPADPIPRSSEQKDLIIAGGPSPTIDESASLSLRFGSWTRIAPYATSIYVAGVILMFLRLFSALCGGQRLRAVARTIPDDPIAGLAERHEHRWKRRFTPIIAYCERIAVPVVVGVVKPAILLPPAIATQLTPEQLEAVLLHELAHIRRYDHLLLLVQRSIEAILFFHPAVWFVSRMVSRERENCCDDFVLRCGSKPDCYAESLVRLSELRHRIRGRSLEPTGALAATEKSSSQLRQRVMRILGQTEALPNMRLTRRGLLVFLAFLGTCLLPFVLIPRTQGGSPQASDIPAGDDKPAVTTDDASEKREESSPASADTTKANDSRPDSSQGGRIIGVGPFTGTVLDPEGRAAAGVKVLLIRPQDEGLPEVLQETTTDATGRFHMEAWRDIFRARAPVPAVVAIDRQGRFGGLHGGKVRFRTGPHWPRIQLMNVGHYQGRLVDASGDPIVGAQVSAWIWHHDSVAGANLPGGFDLSAELINKATDDTNEEGYFILRDVPREGSLAVEIEADGFGLQYVIFDLREATTIQLARPGTLVGCVVAPGRTTGLAGTQVACSITGIHWPDRPRYVVYPSRVRTVTNEHGRFAIDLTPGTYEVFVSPPGGVPYAAERLADVMVKSGQETAVSLALPAAVRIDGRVVDQESGLAIKHARLYPPAIDRGSILYPNVVETDEHGAYSFYVKPGKVSVIMRAKGYGRQTVELAEEVIGNRTWTIELKREALWHIVVVDPSGRPLPDAEVRATKNERTSARCRFEPDYAGGFILRTDQPSVAQQLRARSGGTACGGPVVIVPEEVTAPVRIVVSEKGVFRIAR